MMSAVHLRSALKLVLVTDRKVARRGLPEVVAAAIRGGVTAVILREKDLDDRNFAALAGEILPFARTAGVPVFASLPPGRRLPLGFDSVHLPEDAPSVAECRPPGNAVVTGASVHDAAGIHRRRLEGANWLLVAPIFEPRSKPRLRPPLGIAGLARAIADAAPLPVVALGGIDAARATACLEAGAAGVAVAGAILMDEDPAAAAAGIRRALDAAGPAAAPPGLEP